MKLSYPPYHHSLPIVVLEIYLIINGLNAPPPLICKWNYKAKQLTHGPYNIFSYAAGRLSLRWFSGLWIWVVLCLVLFKLKIWIDSPRQFTMIFVLFLADSVLNFNWSKSIPWCVPLNLLINRSLLWILWSSEEGRLPQIQIQIWR